MNETQLTNQLYSLGVAFLAGEFEFEPVIQTELLIIELAKSREARLRLALIPLFLHRPELSKGVPEVIHKLSPKEAITLKCYYCAAACLQKKYKERLNILFGDQIALPPFFFEELGLLPHGDPQENLHKLAVRQQELTNRSINWLGTYEHAAERLLHHWEKQKAWQI